MSELEMASYLVNLSTAEIERALPFLAAAHGAAWSTSEAGVSTFTALDRAASSDHSPAAAAREWALSVLRGDPPLRPAAGPPGMAGVDGELIDGFVRNLRA